jgi:hypothetical protein
LSSFNAWVSSQQYIPGGTTCQPHVRIDGLSHPI